MTIEELIKDMANRIGDLQTRVSKLEEANVIVTEIKCPRCNKLQADFARLTEEYDIKIKVIDELQEQLADPILVSNLRAEIDRLEAKIHGMTKEVYPFAENDRLNRLVAQIEESHEKLLKQWSDAEDKIERKDAEIAELRETVCLLNSMILSGEKHTPVSLARLESALKTKIKVCNKGESGE